MSAPRERVRRVARVALFVAVACLAANVVQVLAVRWIDPTVTWAMVDQALARRHATGRFTLPRHRWRDLDALGPAIAEAVVSSEDQTFWTNHGFDPEAIRRAIAWNEAHRGHRRGASTITQQVARNVFLWPSRSWLRKGLEVWYTVLLDVLVPKRRILELYLNVAETGPDTFGFEAAAWYWYGEPCRRLDPWQAATLAAILPSPRRWRPDGDYVSARAQWILDNPAPGPDGKVMQASSPEARPP